MGVTGVPALLRWSQGVASMHGTTLGRVAGPEVINPQRGSYRYDYCPQTPKGRRQVLNLRGHTVG